MDDAPEGFIHIRHDTEKHKSDTYVRTTKIVSVEIFTQMIDEKEVPTVLVRTVGRKGADGLAYYINFRNRTEALRAAHRIMALTSAKD